MSEDFDVADGNARVTYSVKDLFRSLEGSVKEVGQDVRRLETKIDGRLEALDGRVATLERAEHTREKRAQGRQKAFRWFVPVAISLIPFLLLVARVGS